MKPRVKKKVSQLPSQPGVYLMKDRRKRVIYVGKARNLKQRVSHYYQDRVTPEPKTTSLVNPVRSPPDPYGSGGIRLWWITSNGVNRIKTIDYLATDSEIDALLLEARLIRDIKPKYNIQLKDDKSFPLLAIIKADDFPRVFITRQRGKKDITYYGPFTNTGDLRSALKLLQRIFKFRTCKRSLKDKKVSKPCLLYHINQCVAPCLGEITKKDYAEIIYLLEEFLKGKKENVSKQLTRKMESASRQQDFEKAAAYRDQINALKGITTEGKMANFYEGALASLNPNERLRDLQALLGLENLPRKIEGIDISDIRGKEAVGSLVTFIDAEPFKNGYRKYKIKTVAEGESDDYARMREVIRRRLFDKENELPDIMLIDGGKGHLSITEKVFAEEKINPPLIVALSKRGGDHFVTNSKSEARSAKLATVHSAGFTLLQYIRDEAHRFAQKYHHLLRKKACLP